MQDDDYAPMPAPAKITKSKHVRYRRDIKLRAGCSGKVPILSKVNCNLPSIRKVVEKKLSESISGWQVESNRYNNMSGRTCIV